MPRWQWADKLNVAAKYSQKPPIMKSINELWRFRQQLNNSIKTIPKKNKAKFQSDLLYLIEMAHEDDYANYKI